MLKTKIIGANSKNLAANVVNNDSLYVCDSGIPAFGEPQLSFIFRDYLKNSSESFAMNIDGSAVPQEFSIKANNNDTFDIYVTSLAFRLQADNMRLSYFGGINTGLINGLDLEYVNFKSPTQNGVVSLSLNTVKTNLDLIRMCLAYPTIENNFQVDVTGAQSAYLPILNFKDFGLIYGIKLAGGTNNRITIRIKDNLTSIATFNVVANGFKLVGKN